MAFPLYNLKFILLIAGTFILIFSSIAIYFCLPILISHFLRTQISLGPTSGSFEGWRFNSVVDQIYLYNISNLDELVNEHTPASTSPTLRIPKLKQIGPFTFRQDREKLNIKFDPSNETVIYDQKKSWTFLPEKSIVKTLEELNSTWISHISVPLSGTTLNAEYAELIDPVVAEFDLRLFLNHSASALLFEGYYDILMEQAKAQGQIDIDRFGWLHNQNNSIARGIRVFSGPSNATLDKFGAIDQINNKGQMNIWHNNHSEPKDTSDVKCNDFRFSSAGEFFPPPERSIISHKKNYRKRLEDNQSDLNLEANLLELTNFSLMHDKASAGEQETDSKVGRTISIFVEDLCRVFKLVYNGTLNYRDLMVDRYIANEFTYDYTYTEEQKGSIEKKSRPTSIQDNKNPNKCFCSYSETTKLTSCPPNGMLDLFNCRKGSPLTISFPHFLYSNKDMTLVPYLKMFEDSIEPSESEHQFFIDLESSLNIPVRAQVVFQFNVLYRNEPSLNFTKEYSYLFDNFIAQANPSQKSPNTFGQNLYLPQMWIKSNAEIDDENLRNLKFIARHLKLVTPILTIILFGIASILLIISAKLAYDLTYEPKTRKPNSRDNQKREQVIFLQLVDDCTSE